ncbi:unnamed protein product [Vitrella brassicaformis CCMP3155]|uniref:MPN domain-containing protein n=1 Tax=Vitrella brassicaformis (strain CCMP3155) TaxID=1169540 RepID=A0A0G4FBP4_VITBC|nr:unnamed protein product [Vitrella brassicaformis CCMP3155]|eukprot:CEM10034.1 unnamed protein product [Vitrella brassicaformis CCMP3155]
MSAGASSSSASASVPSGQTAMKQWELNNSVKEDDSVYKYDAVEQENILNNRPWTNDVLYFKKCRITAVALIKMVMHARSGGRLEIMGLMQGKIIKDAFVIMDAFALPVEGTETRVNAGAGANEYMVNYQEVSEMVGRMENIVGWYHSHPGYGCWLSGIDCQTQMLYQQHQEPFVAVVVDPIRTCASGAVDIGAFRCYPSGYTPPEDGPSDFQPIPLHKIEDFGLHWKQYYPLQIEVFKSSLDAKLLDLLWSNYWASTLASSPLLNNKEYYNSLVQDVADKLAKAETTLSSKQYGGQIMGGSGSKKNQGEADLTEVAKLSARASSEQLKGLANQVIKDLLFNQALRSSPGQCGRHRSDVSTAAASSIMTNGVTAMATDPPAAAAAAAAPAGGGNRPAPMDTST